MEEEKSLKPTSQTIEEKYQIGLNFKQQGNEQFKIKDWKKALGCYHKALLYINGFQTPDSEYYQYANETQKASKELAVKIKQLQHDVYSNMGQIYIYQSKNQKAVDVLDKALKLTENSVPVKILYRKAIAKMNLEEISEAQQLFQEVLQNDPSQKNEVQKHLAKLEQIQKIIDKQAAQSYKKMFS